MSGAWWGGTKPFFSCHSQMCHYWLWTRSRLNNKTTSVKKSLQQRGKSFLQKGHLYRCCRGRRARFCASLLCRVCVTAIYFSCLSELGKHNLVLIIKPPGHAPEWSEANSWYICDVHTNISTGAQHSTAGRDVEAGSQRDKSTKAHEF